jgi:hypothetical protein
MAPGDYVITDDKATNEVAVGLIRDEAEYRPGILDIRHTYLRRAEWLSRLGRSDFTPQAQRDLYSVVGLYDLRPHLREIHQRLTGTDIGAKVELRTMSRGQVLRGSALTLDRSDPARLVLTRHRTFHARRLAGQLAVYGAAVAFLGAFSQVDWDAPGFALFILVMFAAGLGLNMLRALPRMWSDLLISVRGEVLVLDRRSQTVTKQKRMVASFDAVQAVELHSQTYVFEGGKPLVYLTDSGRLLWLPDNPTHLHRLSLRLHDRQEILVDGCEDLRQCLIIAHACLDCLGVPLVKSQEPVWVDSSDSGE